MDHSEAGGRAMFHRMDLSTLLVAVGVVTKEAQASGDSGGGDVALDSVRAASIANITTSAFPEPFFYQGDVPLYVVDRSSKPAESSSASFRAICSSSGRFLLYRI